jgi:hypothetical protein
MTGTPDHKQLRPAEAAAPDDDGFSDEERARLHDAIDRGLAASRDGDHVDAEDLVRELLGRR